MSILKQFGCCLPLKCNNPSPWSTPRSSYRSPRDDDLENEFPELRRQLSFGTANAEQLRQTLLAALPPQSLGPAARGSVGAPAPPSGAKERRTENLLEPDEPPLPAPWSAGAETVAAEPAVAPGPASETRAPQSTPAEASRRSLAASESRRTLVDVAAEDPAHTDEGDCPCQACKSVRRLQATFRGHKLRRELSGRSLVPGVWKNLLKHVNREAVRKYAASAERCTPRPGSSQGSSHFRQWRMANILCSELAEGSSEVEDETLLLETEHWLELTDVKHRYGSNLCPYYLAWRSSDTTQHFFAWLDSGEGKGLDLPERPRAVLEEQRVTYCTEAMRAQYEVGVEDGTGRLVFIHDRRPLHTLLGEGPAEVEEDMANTEEAKRKRNENKWIYVVSPEWRMYVARKVRGRFHHSSFLSGASVLAAGSLVASQGRLLKLTAFSGHYKPRPEDFHRFVERLHAQNVPLDQCKLKESKDPARLAEKAAIKAAKKKAAGVEGAEGPASSPRAAPAPAPAPALAPALAPISEASAAPVRAGASGGGTGRGALTRPAGRGPCAAVARRVPRPPSPVEEPARPRRPRPRPAGEGPAKPAAAVSAAAAAASGAGSTPSASPAGSPAGGKKRNKKKK
eukprot:tig00021318_g20139.t1